MRIPRLIGKPLCICALREQIMPEMVANFVAHSLWQVPALRILLEANATHYEIDPLVKATQRLTHSVQLFAEELNRHAHLFVRNPEQEALYKKKPWLRLQDEHTRNKAKRRKVR